MSGTRKRTHLYVNPAPRQAGQPKPVVPTDGKKPRERHSYLRLGRPAPANVLQFIRADALPSEVDDEGQGESERGRRFHTDHDEAKRCARKLAPIFAAAAADAIPEKFRTDKSIATAHKKGRDRAASLMGLQWDDSGGLIDDPEADKAITGTTEDQVNGIVDSSEQKPFDDPAVLAASLAAVYAFGNERASLVTNYEIRWLENLAILMSFADVGIETVFVIDGDQYDGPCIDANNDWWDVTYAMLNPIEHPHCQRRFLPIDSNGTPIPLGALRSQSLYSEGQPRDEHGRWAGSGLAGADRPWNDYEGKVHSPETVGQWLDRHTEFKREGDKVIAYHGTPRSTPFDTLRKGSYLASDSDEARHYAGRDRDLKPKDVRVYKLRLGLDEFQPGMFAQVSKNIDLSKHEFQDGVKRQRMDAEFEAKHPRDEGGRFGESGGGMREYEQWSTRSGGERGDLKWNQPTNPETNRPIPIKVNSVEEAIPLVLQGKVVEMPEIRQVNTLLGRLGEMANEAKAKGLEAPDFNLCNVTVAHTNLFCADRVRTMGFPSGIPRIEMPQVAGEAVPGTPAALLPKQPNGEVDGSAEFISWLKGTPGYNVTEERVNAGSLKASQAELKGVTVAGIMHSAETGNRAIVDSPIFISKDNYIIDGHHRWAAVVGMETAKGDLNIQMNVHRIDAPVSEVLRLADGWARHYGIKQAPGTTKAKKAAALRAWAERQRLFDEAQARDERGRWAGDGAFPTTEEGMKAATLDTLSTRYGQTPKTKDGTPIIENTRLIVYHSTDPKLAEEMATNGIGEENKPMTIARERYDKGENAVFAPGAGVDKGLYVTASPQDASGYGYGMVAVSVRAGDLKLPAEANPIPGTPHLTQVLDALAHGDIGAVIHGSIHKDNVRVIEHALGRSYIPIGLPSELKKLAAEYVEDQHPRDEHGRWTSNEVREASQRLYHQAMTPDARGNRGFTYSMITKSSPTTGYVVSTHLEAEKAINAETLKAWQVADFIRGNAELLKQPGHSVGGWYDTDTGAVVLDVVSWTPDQKEAETLASTHQQKEYWDVANRTGIKVASTTRQIKAAGAARQWARAPGVGWSAGSGDPVCLSAGSDGGGDHRSDQENARGASQRVALYSESQPRDEHGRFAQDVEISKIALRPLQYRNAIENIAAGKSSRTTGPVKLDKSPSSGVLTVEDGYHRIVEAHQRGETTIKAFVTPQEESWLRPNEKRKAPNESVFLKPGGNRERLNPFTRKREKFAALDEGSQKLYSDDQPRDEHGRFVSTGGGDGSVSESTDPFVKGAEAAMLEHQPWLKEPVYTAEEFRAADRASLPGDAKNISDFERASLDNFDAGKPNLEVGAWTTANGEMKWKLGSPPEGLNNGQIHFTPDELDTMKGGVFTHIHPSGQSFSPNDLYTASEHGFGELRAFGRADNGREYVYSMKPEQGKGWPQIGNLPDKPNFVDPHDPVSRAIDAADETQFLVLEKLIHDGKVSVKDANTEHWHDIWTKLAPKFGLAYKRTEIK